jgi:PAS domain-containing protein
MRRIEARFIAVDGNRVLTIIRDITNRWRSEQELRETQHRYALATAAGGIGVWDLDVNSGELRVLGNLKELLGYGDADIAGSFDAWQPLFHPEDRDEVTARFNALLTGEAMSFDIQFRLLKRDGFRLLGGEQRCGHRTGARQTDAAHRHLHRRHRAARKRAAAARSQRRDRTDEPDRRRIRSQRLDRPRAEPAAHRDRRDGDDRLALDRGGQFVTPAAPAVPGRPRGQPPRYACHRTHAPDVSATSRRRRSRST